MTHILDAVKFITAGKEFRENADEIIINCPYCHSEKKTFSINRTSGAAICNRANNCGWKGHVTQAARELGWHSTETTKMVRSVTNIIKPINFQIPEDITKLSYITTRGISIETAKKFGVYETELEIHFPYYWKGKLYGIKHRKIKEKGFYSEKGQTPTLFGIDQVKGREIFIFEGEIDMLTWFECGYENGVSVPFGAGTGNKNQWIDTHWDELEAFNVIYIATDNDKAGNQAANDIANRLGRHRCRRLTWNEKDFNECWVSGNWSRGMDWQFLIKEMKPEMICHPSEFEDGVIDEIFGDSKKTYETSITNFDKFQYRPTEVTVFTGKNADGKSTFLNQEAIHKMDQGVNVCIASLELHPKRILKWLCQQISYPNELTQSIIRQCLNWLTGKLTIVNCINNINPESLIECFEYSSARYGSKFFIIDPLFKVTLKGSDILESEKLFMNMLTSFAHKTESHVVLVAHQRKVDDDSVPTKYGIAGSANISNAPDNVISITRIPYELKRKNPHSADAKLEVLKQRETGEYPKANLIFCQQARRFVNMDPVQKITTIDISKEAPF